ncbi:unnamed protein product, partial [Medioppia subpectinata]
MDWAAVLTDVWVTYRWPRLSFTNDMDWRTPAMLTSASGHTLTYSEIRFKCDECSQTYGTDRQLKRHQMCRHGVRQSNSRDREPRDRQYDKGSHLAAHIRDKLGYRCPYDRCARRFESYGLLQGHRLRAHCPYRCDYEPCDRRYSTNDALRGHQQSCCYRLDARRTLSTSSSHRSTEKTYRCDVCPQRFSKRALLDAHICWPQKRRSGHSVTPDGRRFEDRESERARNRSVSTTTDAGDQTPTNVSHKLVDPSVALNTAHNNSQTSDSIELNNKYVKHTSDAKPRTSSDRSRRRCCVNCGTTDAQMCRTNDVEEYVCKSCDLNNRSHNKSQKTFKCNEEDCGFYRFGCTKANEPELISHNNYCIKNRITTDQSVPKAMATLCSFKCDYKDCCGMFATEEIMKKHKKAVHQMPDQLSLTQELPAVSIDNTVSKVLSNASSDRTIAEAIPNLNLIVNASNGGVSADEDNSSRLWDTLVRVVSQPPAITVTLTDSDMSDVIPDTIPALDTSATSAGDKSPTGPLVPPPLPPPSFMTAPLVSPFSVLSDMSSISSTDTHQRYRIPSLTYEEIVNQSYDRLKCDYENCGKSFFTQSRLNLHIRLRHAIKDNTQFGEPIGRSSHVRHQSLSAALDDRQQMQVITTTEPSLATTSTTFNPDSQSLDNKRHNDSDSDIELIGRVPAPKRPARNRSPVDIKPSLIDSIPLVPEIVNRSLIDIKPVINTSPPESSTVHNSPLVTTTTGAGNERSHELGLDIHRCPESNTSNKETLVPSTTTTTVISSGPTVASSEKPYKCDKCGQSYGRDRELKQHRELRHGVREPYRCHQRDRRYDKESQLTAHMRDNRSARVRRYRCPYPQCDRRFKSPRLLEEHRLRAHCPYRCDYKPCDRRCDTSISLRAHRQSCRYRPEKPQRTFKCNEEDCGENFNAKADLIRHKRTHRFGRETSCSSSPSMSSNTPHLHYMTAKPDVVGCGHIGHMEWYAKHIGHVSGVTNALGGDVTVTQFGHHRANISELVEINIMRVRLNVTGKLFGKHICGTRDSEMACQVVKCPPEGRFAGSVNTL